VECTVSEGVVKVVFQHYCHGLATALLVNHTIDTAVEYSQKYLCCCRILTCVCMITAITCVEWTFFVYFVIKLVTDDGLRALMSSFKASLLLFVYYCL